MQVKQRIILVGGGGHCRACIDVIEAGGKLEVAGIVDVEEKIGQRVSGHETIACDEDLSKLAKEYEYFLVTLGQIKSADKRMDRFEYLKNLGAKFPVVVSSSAYVSKTASVGEGTIVMHRAVVNANATVGKNCIVNTGATVEHDTRIGDHCHISTGSIINGGCSIGEKSFVGSNSVIANNIDIAEGTIIGAGSVVVSSVNESGVYAGNPIGKLGENA
jgi:sugar O-acyltransferase (sialic acid O-acetyltransferase NeuD family)